MVWGKRGVLVLLLGVGALAFLGCEWIEDFTDERVKEEPRKEETKEEKQLEQKKKEEGFEPLQVGIIFSPSGLNDLSVNDFAYRGIQEAEENLGIEWDYKQPEDAGDYEAGLQSFAQEEKDLVIGVCASMEASMVEAAQAYPDADFALIYSIGESSWDTEYGTAFNEERPENMVAVDFARHEAAFLAGALAAMATETGVIGFVGGDEMGWVNRLEKGYRQGAKYVNDRIVVVSEHVEDFDAPALGREAAESLINRGTDIAFGAAGDTSVGVFETFQAYNFSGITSDSSHNWVSPGHLITATIDRIDTAIYEVIEKRIEEKLNGGEKIYFDLESGGVEISSLSKLTWWEEKAAEEGYISTSELEEIKALKDELAEVYKDDLNEIKVKILQGQIEVEGWIEE